MYILFVYEYAGDLEERKNYIHMLSVLQCFFNEMDNYTGRVVKIWNLIPSRNPPFPVIP